MRHLSVAALLLKTEDSGMIGFMVFGLVVGAVARLVVPGRQNLSIAMTLVLGLVGSIVGGVVANALGTGDVFELNIVGSIVAIAAAVVLILVGDRLAPPSPTRSPTATTPSERPGHGPLHPGRGVAQGHGQVRATPGPDSAELAAGVTR